MYAACKPTTVKEWWIERVNSLGIDVGKKKCRAALKDERGNIIREFFSNNNEGISALIQSASHYGKCTAVVVSTGNMWIRIHDTLEQNGIYTILANPHKTKIIAEAKIKSARSQTRCKNTSRSIEGRSCTNPLFQQKSSGKREVLSDIESHWSETEQC